ncbi:thiol:disulfide interchange protein DsbG [Oceanospirillum sediminis]|uniref:Thiol:disulfide interchange protein DsbG n=1 Tax=Oceanospirillum sediminis TaxID=2760088 RepID=A0A839ITM0_9GAMM|nr:thiol:disulfide interchange protein DsbG [Oceanospirillum sediminis]MBB1488803.1 thiol:disulfide interchange protein DsbG [Oceanospirillum sediminis]
MRRFSFLTALGFGLSLISSSVLANINTQTSNPVAATSVADQNITPLPDNITSGPNDERIPELPAAIVRLLEQGMTLESRFDAGAGLTGWLLSVDDRFTLLYSTADHSTLISGTLLDQNGQNLSEQHMQQYLPRPDIQVLEKAWSVQQHSADTEAAAHTVYVFFDPACPFCRLSWQAFKPYVQKGADIRWVPVAFLQPASRIAADRLMQSDNPLNTLQNMMEHPKQASEIQATASGKEVSDQRWQSLQHNMELMQRFGLQGTPAMVWQDADGQIKTFSGMPELKDFASITGLPEQPQTAPELSRFR